MQIPHSKPFVSDEDSEIVKSQINSSMHAPGEKTKELEEKMCKLLNVKYAKATNSGTAAIHLALLALDIKKDDEVIIPSYVCQSVMNAIKYTGATPILVDINPDFVEKGCNISEQTIKQSLTEKTKAIIVPHMFGIPANIDGIKKLAEKHNTKVIEDCALSLGAKYKGKPVGSFGYISIFSFYATKMLSTGHGGMITTNSKNLFNKIEDLLQYDKRETYKVAYNYGLTDIQAALGIYFLWTRIL